ncbi:HNH endonuclease [Salinimicrobium flavum]|uniref:HNH endonuclease n=1 Tax=Salinimicrobium flavum TaxID=1737065 RepID=A0ABW5IZM7_9FLAO
MRQLYKFRNSDLDDFHGYIVFFFESIYFQSLTNYNDWNNYFIHSELKPFVKATRKLKPLLEKIHEEFLKVNQSEKKLVFDSARNSLDIQGICHSEIPLAHKKDLSNDLGNAIHALFHYIYYQLPQTKIFTDKYGKLINHYEEIKRLNNDIKSCPFCGLHPIKPLESKTRQTYDHYLPLSHYPFVGFNTQNLVPTCKPCNEDYKKDKEVLHSDTNRQNRRKLIFPYGNYAFSPKIKIDVLDYDPDTLKINRCLVNIGTEENICLDEMRTWCEIYEVDTRYRNIIVNDSDSWFDEFLEFHTQQQIDQPILTKEDNFQTFMNSIKIQESTSNVILKRPYFNSMSTLTNAFSNN